MGHCILFLSMVLITLVAFSSGKQYRLLMIECIILSIEHSYSCKQNKYRTYTFPMDRWGPTETCSKSVPVYKKSYGNYRAAKRRGKYSHFNQQQNWVMHHLRATEKSIIYALNWIRTWKRPWNIIQLRRMCKRKTKKFLPFVFIGKNIKARMLMMFRTTRPLLCTLGELSFKQARLW